MKTDIAQTTVVEVRSATPGQIKDIGATLLQGIPGELSFDAADKVLAKKGKLIALIMNFMLDAEGDNLSWWTEFYRQHFGLTADFSGLKIPLKPTKGKWRLLVILKDLTINQVYDVCASKFPCRERGDLDKAVPTNERDSKDGSYAIWVRDVVEADEAHKSKSANMVKAENLKSETVLERVIHELVYFLETGEHLDIVNVTLCSGSRSPDGSVPRAYWCGDGFGVYYWCNPGSRGANLRPREVKVS